MKYKVTITETLRRDVEVEAGSMEEAEQLVNDQWNNSDHVLGADDFYSVYFEAEEIRPEKMKVVLLEPNKIARIAEIGTSLEAMQAVVGGSIEAAYYFPEPVCLVCNEEGKITGLPLNRGVYDNDKNLMDVIAGTAFICDCSGENFASLTDEQLAKYKKEFKYPERFYRLDNEIKGMKFNPERNNER